MVTLKDIAAEAGVSITTVSNVVHNKKSRVSPERVAKIWEIINREHYVPSMSARSLANDHSSIIGVITHITPQNTGSTMSDPFLSAFVDSIEKRTREEGYYLMVRSVEDAGALEAAHRRLVFDEFLSFIYNVRRSRQVHQRHPGRPLRRSAAL